MIIGSTHLVLQAHQEKLHELAQASNTFYPHDEYREGQEERKFLSLSSTMLKL